MRLLTAAWVTFSSAAEWVNEFIRAAASKNIKASSGGSDERYLFIT